MLKARHVAYCPGCGSSATRVWAWSAERWLDRHERQCVDLADVLGGRYAAGARSRHRPASHAGS